ncbi:hypothetical protein AAFF_G00224000 [Aldrovandia affinis]|uniref:LysM and putative peptidoglycan-binding domain-containing protein 4 n=1 Tax=Aldrovandia affinis TaxID=143900 RepID=A0AAD7TAT9_9TELE|nr:hypothetical protein AAFF_G00224000 [Aldrovandia affinis]
MWRTQPATHVFQAPVNVRANADGQVYMFRGGPGDLAGSSSSSEEEEELVVMELRSRTRECAGPEREKVGDVLLLERPIAHGDNLNKLALQYGCKVADLKRVNNLMQEQDLYALKSVKIPIKRHGLLTEAQLSPSAMPPPSSVVPRSEGYADFLEEIDRDIERLTQSSGSGQQGVLSGASRGAQPVVNGQTGADWGIQWWNAVVVMLLVGVILPLFYVVYYRTQDGAGAGTSLDTGAGNVSFSTSNGTLTNVSAPAFPRKSLSHVLDKPLR